MPTLSLNGGPWQRDSSALLVAVGFQPLLTQDQSAIQAAWQGVVHRPQNPIRFLYSFARAGDVSTSAFTRSFRNAGRGFIALYMLTLFIIVRVSGKVTDPEDWGEQFLYWEDALSESEGPFIDGAAPGSRDLLLFGMVQCHASIPVPPLESLRGDIRLRGLREWIGRMQQRFAETGHLYSGQYFEPAIAAPKVASFGQQILFYLGFVFVVACLPVTLPLILFLIVKAPR